MGQKIIQKILESGCDITSLRALKKTIQLIGFKPDNVDRLYVELKNNLNEEKYKKISPKDTIVFLPHCLRSIECKAELSKTGYKCKMCGKCKISKIIKELSPHGYRIYIVPGASLLIKVALNEKPKAIVGVACIKEILLAFDSEKDLHIFDAMISVELLRDGCIETDVDVDEVVSIVTKNSF